MPGLVPGIHVFKLTTSKDVDGRERRQVYVVCATLPAMTKKSGMATRTMLTEAATYNELYRNFRWDIPARFNMATACCDRHADGTKRLALVYVDEDGATTHTSFDEVAEASRRLANVLKADGLVCGDRVAVFLSQSLELLIAHLAAFRSGMISIRCLRCSARTRWNSGCRIRKPKQSSPTRAAGRSSAKIRDRLPALKNVYVIGGKAPAGTKPFGSSLKAASPDFATVDTSADDPAADHLHFGHHRKSKGRAARPSRRAGQLPNSRCATIFC